MLNKGHLNYSKLGKKLYGEATQLNCKSFEIICNGSWFWQMGSILGLGIYNGVILDIHFPLVKSLSSLETLHTIVLGVK
jgi:hypothetical protein